MLACFGDLAHFFTLFAAWVGLFGGAGHMLYGHAVDQFNSLPASFGAVTMMAIGEFEPPLGTMRAVSRPRRPLLFLLAHLLVRRSRSPRASVERRAFTVHTRSRMCVNDR